MSTSTQRQSRKAHGEEDGTEHMKNELNVETEVWIRQHGWEEPVRVVKAVVRRSNGTFAPETNTTAEFLVK